jgi:putative membrane protein
MKWIASLLIKMAAVVISAWFLPGVQVSGLWSVFWLVVVLVPIDLLIRPILHLLTLPITVITLGIFALIINGLMVLLASEIVPGFIVEGLMDGILFSLLLGLVTSILQYIFVREDK